MADETRGPTPRVLLMEFEIPTGSIGEPMQKSLEAQFGIEEGKTVVDAVGEKMTVLVAVGNFAGGPKEIIEAQAKTPGLFRAIALESFEQKKRVREPDAPQFVIEDV